MGTSAISAGSIAGQGVEAGAVVAPKLDLGKVGSPNWTNLLGADLSGTNVATHVTMRAAVQQARTEKLINAEQEDFLKKAIDKIPAASSLTYAEASQLLTDIGLDVSRTVTFTASSTGKTVMSFVDFGTDQKPNWANLIANQTSNTDVVSSFTMGLAVESANAKGLIGPKQTAYLKTAIADLDMSNLPTLKEAVAQLEAIGLDITKVVDTKALNAIPGGLAVTDANAGAAQKPDWASLIASASAGKPGAISSFDLTKAVDSARTAGVINGEQQQYIKDAVLKIPYTASPTPAEGAQLLTDIGLDVKKPVEITTGPTGSPVVSHLDVGVDQKPNWTNLLSIETSGNDTVFRTNMTQAVEAANSRGLIGPKQTAYLKGAIEKLDASTATDVAVAAAQLSAIGLVVTKEVDLKAINALRGTTP